MLSRRWNEIECVIGLRPTGFFRTIAAQTYKKVRVGTKSPNTSCSERINWGDEHSLTTVFGDHTRREGLIDAIHIFWVNMECPKVSKGP